MKITPIDIRHKEFKRALRGYSEEEVDIFLDEVADDFELVFKENMELQDEVRRLKEQVAQYETLKDTLQKTLVSAQQQADATQVNARKEAELVLRDAEIKARGIVGDAYSEKQKVQQSVLQLRQAEDDFRFKFKSLLEAHLNLLLEDEASDERRRLRGASAGDGGGRTADKTAEPTAVTEDTAPHPGPSTEEAVAVPVPAVPVSSEASAPTESHVGRAADMPIPDNGIARASGSAPLAAPVPAEVPTLPGGSAKALALGATDDVSAQRHHDVPEPPVSSSIVHRPPESRPPSPEPAVSSFSTPERPIMEPRRPSEPDQQFRGAGELDLGPDLDEPLGGIGSGRDDEERRDLDQKGKKESSVRRFFFGSKGEGRTGGQSVDDREFDW